MTICTYRVYWNTVHLNLNCYAVCTHINAYEWCECLTMRCGYACKRRHKYNQSQVWKQRSMAFKSTGCTENTVFGRSSSTTSPLPPPWPPWPSPPALTTRCTSISNITIRVPCRQPYTNTHIRTWAHGMVLYYFIVIQVDAGLTKWVVNMSWAHILKRWKKLCQTLTVSTVVRSGIRCREDWLTSTVPKWRRRKKGRQKEGESEYRVRNVFKILLFLEECPDE